MTEIAGISHSDALVIIDLLDGIESYLGWLIVIGILGLFGIWRSS